MNNSKVSVLFLVFNRPELSVATFESIKSYKPDILYIAADGPRKGNDDDFELCQKTRNKILEKVDWECTVYKLFRSENLGCGRAVSEAISWFFSKEEYGIIVEDDCSPVIEFFDFCEILLPKYRNESRVMQINGFNPTHKNSKCNSFSFSGYPKIWGWATWKRAWDNYDFKLEKWPEYKKSRIHFEIFPFYEAFVHERIWDNYYKELRKSNNPRTWDLQWSVCVFFNRGLCIVPDVNMVLNTGIGQNSTNCNNKDYFKGVNYGRFLFPVEFPAEIKLDILQNQLDSKRYMKSRFDSLFFKIKNLIWRR